MKTTFRGTVLVLILSFALAGCASADDKSASERSTPSPSASPSPSGAKTTPPSTSPPSGSLPSPPKPKPGETPGRTVLTVSGTVSTGTEAGCLMLAANGTQYQLVGGDRASLRPGRKVQVLGEVQPELATTCQQGTPLMVRQIKIG